MKSWKLLFVGNSFAVDTMEHAADIALDLGIEEVKLGTLYVGGCSIAMHDRHASENTAAYTYYVNEGKGWSSTPEVAIQEAVESEAWDWIAIQHGTRGTARYTSIECYERLNPLIDYLKERAPQAKIAFNLTWLGESGYEHHEILSYGGDMARMREKLVEVTKQVVQNTPKLDLLIPTGTAIENARTSRLGILTRDGYHLSKDKGRYIAGLALVGTVTGLDVARARWLPENVDEYTRQVAIESVQNAQNAPFEIIKSCL